MSTLTLPELAEQEPVVRRILEDRTVGHTEAFHRISNIGPTSPTSVRRYRSNIEWIPADDLHTEPGKGEETVPDLGTGRCIETSDGGEFQNVTLPEPIVNNDWTHIFKLFKLDPEQFTIIDDTVRTSTWQQSKRLENGDRDTTQLYAYSCRFRKLGATPVSDEDFEIRRQRVQAWKPPLKPLRRLPGTMGEPSTLVVNWADWQLGKSEGGGVAATEQRVLDSFEKTETRLRELRKTGRNVEGIALVNMGDPTEGCQGNYASQTFSVELTQRRQILLAMDLFEQGILTFASLAEKCDVIGTLCNHGEWTRKDGKPITTDSDNVSGFLLDALQRVFKSRPDMKHINWHIPQDEMVTMVNLSGVNNAFTHGHKITGGTLKAEENWLRGQSIHLLRTLGSEPRLWTTAHRHHAFVIDMGPWHRIQCSALDGGSKWFLDSSGQWSTPGTTTYLAGNHDVRGFSDYAVL
jgi:hypothetical protein